MISALGLANVQFREKKLKVGFGSFPAVQPISDDYTFNLWPVLEYEGLNSANSGHSRYKENPACAGFLNGDFRPEPDIQRVPLNVSDAA